MRFRIFVCFQNDISFYFTCLGVLLPGHSNTVAPEEVGTLGGQEGLGCLN